MEWNFGDVFLTMLTFFFWILYIWMFIAIFGDIFRRHDLSGWAKAGWTLLIFIVPVVGVLAYIVVRPRVVEADKYAVGRFDAPRGHSYSSADEIAKLAQLHHDGVLSDAEYHRLRDRTVA